MNTYAYIRVSTKTQNISRQLDEIIKLDINNKNIFIDKESGKDFNRKNYQKLLKKLKKDDLLIIKSLDRLGRNYYMILEEWTKITKHIGADIKVIDMPLLDTRTQPNNLIGSFISDIVLQLLSFVAENERNNIRERQKEGIKIAKEKGVRFGRPKKELPSNTFYILNNYLNNIISSHEAIKSIGISKSSFFRLIKEYKNN